MNNIILLPIDLPKLELNRDKTLEYFDVRKERHQDWNWVNFKKTNQPIDPELLQFRY